MTKDELVSWFKEHRGQGSRKLSVHVSNAFSIDVAYYFEKNMPSNLHQFHLCLLKVVGFGAEESDEESGGKTQEEEGKDEDSSGSAYGEVSKLSFLPASPKMEGAVAVMDIPAFTGGLPLFPYHKILK